MTQTNAISFLGTLYVVARRLPRATRARGAGHDEHAISALKAGGRYVRHSPVIRRILLRALLFLPAASAVWALLPVMARGFLHLGSRGYGLLLGAVGAGALVMAFVLPKLDSVGDLGGSRWSSVLMGHTRGWFEGPSQLVEVLVVRPSTSW